LRLTWKAVLRTMATAAKPASAMKAMNRSVVVKRDQVCMEWFRTVNIIACLGGGVKGG